MVHSSPRSCGIRSPSPMAPGDRPCGDSVWWGQREGTEALPSTSCQLPVRGQFRQDPRAPNGLAGVRLVNRSVGTGPGGCGPRAWTSLVFFTHLSPHPRPCSRPPPGTDPSGRTEEVQCESRVMTAVAVLPLLTCHFINLPGSPGSSSGPKLGKHSPAWGMVFFSVVVSLLEQIKLAVFDSGDESELARCHLAVGCL